ncbi:dynamin family protein [Geoalkalibacter halelectricus]|uniref:Dynamin family protein n=1 Tax=Geoalkalibacter halelectricus TaxID=2847045 RepID=A0ABY5ZLW5_9BACT|nr:dynamin family protein [Geoalkalibacter halelectricus]MDO3378529.1 dynamin family protein [Geoalkalibacter halelectricus]UWZ80157.1 dynamin family protein [Geoalkalibacter halelectricus]
MSEPSASITRGSEQPLAETLARAQDCLADLGAGYETARADLDQLGGRLAEGRFHLAVLGQFKRGKSTLLNALLGEDLLPTDILPATSIPTYILAGEALRVRVYFLDEAPPQDFLPSAQLPLSQVLADYVSEQGNPHNRRGVSRVEIFHPAALLRQGVVLIDTPGIGSTLRHNTEITQQTLPRCDAAVFLVSPDPPLTETELEFLGRARALLPRIFYLFNKIDYLDGQELQASLNFLRAHLREVEPQGEGPRIFPISARQALAARLGRDEQGLRASGLAEVEDNLIDFLRREKMQVLQAALKRQAGDVFSDAVMKLRVTLSALKLPQEELQQRLDQFHQTLPEIEREQLAASDVLSGDLKRLVAHLHDEMLRLRERALKDISPDVETYLDSIEDPEEMERLVRSTLERAIPKFFAPALQTLTQAVREQAVKVLQLHQLRSNNLIEQVRRNAADIFAVPYQAPAGEAAYIAFAPPSTWNTQVMISDLDPLGQRLSRKLLSRRFRRNRTVKRLRHQYQALIGQNIEQISWALRQSLEESFRRYDADLREQLKKTVGAAQDAVRIAMERKRALRHETAAEEVQLQRHLERLLELQQSLG